MATQNYAIHMNGVDLEHWTLADNAALDYATGNNFTVGMWIRLDWDAYTYYDKTTKGLPVYLWSRQNQQEMILRKDGNTLRDNTARLVYTQNSVEWDTGIRLQTDRTYFLVITGVESGAVGTWKVYINGELEATKTDAPAMAADTTTALFVGIDYGTTAGQYFKGNMTSFIHDNDEVLTAANVITDWNDGVQDMDLMVATGSLDTCIPFDENTGTTYDNDNQATYDGAGQNTPTWVNKLDPMDAKCEMGTGKPQGFNYDFTGVAQNTGKTLLLQRVEWHDDAITKGDILLLRERNGALIIRHVAEKDDTGTEHEFNGRLVKGLQVETLSAGTLNIAIR